MSGRETGHVAEFEYAPAVDGIRALAVAAVLLFHADAPFASGGFLGVSVFFTVSGFLVATLLLDEHARTGHIDLTSFAHRRIRRLLPAAFAGVALALAAAPWWTRSQLDRLPGDAAAAIANVFNWRAATGDTSYRELFETSPSPLAHFWSLAIEMQFYIALPLISALALRAGGRRLFTATIAVLLAGSVIATITTDDFDFVYNGTHTRAGELLLGVLLAVVLFERRQLGQTLPPRSGSFLAALSLTGLAGLVATTTLTSDWLVGGGLIGVAALSCALIVAATGHGLGVRLLSLSPLVAVGRVSYGIYLFHWPIFLILSPERVGIDGPSLFAIRGLATAAATLVSYHLLETPIRRSRILRRPLTAVPAALATIIALSAGVLAIPAPAADDTSELLALGDDGPVRFTAITPTVERERPADVSLDTVHPEPTPPATSSSTTSTTTPELPPLRVVIVGGDSDAATTLADIARANDARSIEIVDLVRTDCPFADAAEVAVDGRIVDVSHCGPLPGRLPAEFTVDTTDLLVVAPGALDDGVLRRSTDEGFPNEDEFTELDELARRSELTRLAIDELVAPFDDAAVPVVMSSRGAGGLLDLELGRIDARRRSVVGDAYDEDDLRRLARRALGLDVEQPTRSRVLVLGDSTSLVLARALHGGDDRLDVLWAGDNGCPIVPATHIHGGDGGGDRKALDCPELTEKLPPILADFAPDVVIVVPGTIALADLTFPGSDDVHEPGTPAWTAHHDRAFAALLATLRPTTPDEDSPIGPAVLVADSPAIERGPFSTPQMVRPERLDAVNAQIDRWAATHDGVDILDYAGPLQRYEAEHGSIRPDRVHPATIELTAIASESYVGPVLAAAAR